MLRQRENVPQKDGQDAEARRERRLARIVHRTLGRGPVRGVVREVREVLELELDRRRLRKAARVVVVLVGERLARREVHLAQGDAGRRRKRGQEAVGERLRLGEEHRRIRRRRGQRPGGGVGDERTGRQQAAEHADRRLKHIQAAVDRPVQLVTHPVARARVPLVLVQEDERVERVDNRVAQRAALAQEVRAGPGQGVELVEAPRMARVRVPRLRERLAHRRTLLGILAVLGVLGDLVHRRQAERHLHRAALGRGAGGLGGLGGLGGRRRGAVVACVPAEPYAGCKQQSDQRPQHGPRGRSRLRGRRTGGRLLLSAWLRHGSEKPPHPPGRLG